MAAHKGHPKLGGRKKGTPNKNTLPLHEKAKELGVDPFEVLLHFAAGNWEKLGYGAEKTRFLAGDGVSEKWTIDPSVRAKAATEACQYLYPKKKAIEHSGEIGLPANVAAAAAWVASASDEDLEKFIKKAK